MNKIFIVFMLLLTVAISGTTVNVADQCKECIHYKSQTDCQTKTGCTWTAASGTTAGSCGKTPETPVTQFQAYCPGITTGSTCAQSYGCAYLDGKCTHFAGCTAYVKTTTTDCQAISYLCISNGTTCTDTKECKDYDQGTCEITPNVYKRKCKWDTTCRTYACTEADATVNSDTACDAFSAGCVTTGAGCVAATLPNCPLLPGNDQNCPNMKGSDGKCKFVSGTTCALKTCADFPAGTPTDSDCVAFQSFCLKSTGKGCVAALDKCSSYTVTNAVSDCAGLKGTDGDCEGDAAATVCRARKCENGTGTTDETCNTYKSGCLTNGVKCVDARSKCSDYTGTLTSCLNYLGSDGKCKGTTATTAACTLRDCEADSKTTYTTDALCQSNIQISCLSNGAGCAKSLPKCNTYAYTSTDGAECNTKIGQDGRCKVGTSMKCAPRVCTEAPTSTNSTDTCAAYQTGCVTTGAGCVASTFCALTVKEKSCTSTIETGASVVCNWNAICVSNTSCSNYNTPALCAGYKISVTVGVTTTQYPCIWDVTCRQAQCTDYIGTSYANDTACDNALTGCVYNGVTGCVSPKSCSNFKGLKATCLGFKAYCTNTDTAAATDVCIIKTCADTGLTYTTDNDCTNYLPGCLTDGSGCIANTAPCNLYTGTPDECDKFQGYYSTVQGARCWNTVSTSGACTEKSCSHATGMNLDSDCETFLKGCLYNGNGGCVTASSGCSSYTGSSTGTCSGFKGATGTAPCWWTSGSNCITKACYQDSTSATDGDCATFLTSCVTKGTGCIDPTTVCSGYSGTSAQCNSFTYKPSLSTATPIKCTRLEGCIAKTCPTKTDAASNTDCLNYHNTCRSTYGSGICQLEKAACTGYALTGTDDVAKSTYCNAMTTDNNTTLCGYKSTVTGTCSARTCDIWVSTLTTPCVDYAGTASCKLSSNGACYAAGACNTYTIASSVTDKLVWCNAMIDGSKKQCTYIAGTSTTVCQTLATCENVVSPTSAANCNEYLPAINCQYYGGKCYTTDNACTTYLLAGIATANYSAYCSALKQDPGQAVTWCKYAGSGSTCVAKTCADVTSATSQNSCDFIVPGCTYYSGGCYTPAACIAYTIPLTYTTNDAKRLFCQNMKAGADFCSFTDGASLCAAGITCASLTTGQTADTCKVIRSTTTKVVCANAVAACADSTGAAICSTLSFITATSDYDCDIRTNPGICYNKAGVCTVLETACTDYAFTGTTADEKAASCQKFRITAFKCSWISAATCETSRDTCILWTVADATVDNTAFCKARIDKTGIKCSYDKGASTCRDALAWEDVTNLQSQSDCDQYEDTSAYKSKYCHIPDADCGTYLAFGSTDAEKSTYCNSLANNAAVPCTFINGSSYCITKGACASYTVSGITDKTVKQTVCNAIITTDVSGCTYWTGTACQVKSVNCSGYSAGAAADCPAQKNTGDLTCQAASSGTACESPATCEAITSPGSQADCDKYVASCIFYSSKCYTLSACNIYTVPVSGIVSFCKAMRATSITGTLCTAASEAATACAARACSDASYTTHAQCAAYLSTCKSNGSTCIDASITCTSQSGNPTQCQWFQDADGLSTCIDTTASTSPLGCISRQCTQNVTLTADSECDAYLAGCLTDGLGCIASTEPCTSYYGTTSVCKAFTGNKIKCWGTSETVTGACRDRTCADNTTATSDPECDTFLPGCLTTGAGCISKSSGCSAYKGTQDTCKAFKGSGKTVLCYNTSAATATTACKDRACTDLAGTSDTDCAAFIPAATTTSPPVCVTNGASCVSYPKNCADFKGTETTCPKFTAFDGPCKTTTYTTTAAACTQKVCSEAPNNIITDTDCKKYHPTCVTTGRGCMKASILCGDVQTQTACSAKTGCLWANQCRAAPTSCSTLTTLGQTICVNTLQANKKSCAWSGSTCHSFTCADYDASYATHDKCNVDTTCTTNGAGCIKMEICSQYKTPAICAAATTTETAIRCQWIATASTAICRARQCSDGAFTTDDECNTYLKGCKTSGTACIGPTYNCSVFTGNEKYCLQDSARDPCLYRSGVCYNYADCGDATASNLSGCQAFNQLCVPTSTISCLAQTSCDKYTEQQSCTVGISNTVCGWLSTTSKCQVFGACSDAAATSNTDCYNYGSKCVTDGAKCVDIGKCDSYLTSQSCTNAGTDGACNWVASSNSCRLRQCGDKVATSDADCASWIVTTGICTTDGTTCVARAACTSYGSEAACTIGSDGVPCIFSFPVGSTTGTKSCRVKECSDIAGTTNDLCIGQISGKACVSNGKICVKQDACGNYKNKLSCNGGGTDGFCAFTAAATTADPLNGSCVAFSSCDKANTDQTTCTKKSTACQWLSTTTGTTTTTSCTAKSCAQAASGTTCNPVPSFDGKTYTVCALANNVCTAQDPSVLTSTTCYTKSVYTYTWSESTSKCVSCTGTTTPTNNSTGGNTTTNTTDNTTTTNGYILGVSIPLVIMGLFA